jgi:hypothetical protein
MRQKSMWRQTRCVFPCVRVCVCVYVLCVMLLYVCMCECMCVYVCLIGRKLAGDIATHLRL